MANGSEGRKERRQGNQRHESPMVEAGEGKEWWKERRRLSRGMGRTRINLKSEQRKRGLEGMGEKVRAIKKRVGKAGEHGQ